MMERTFIVILGLTILLFFIGLAIGIVERKRLERKQEHMEYLEEKQKEYYAREQYYTEGLKKEKEEYERLLNELDRSSLPTKEQMKKLHWYMRHYGVLDQQQQQRLNQFYDKNHPNP